MDSTLVTAWVAALSALLVAGVSLVTALLSQRASAKASKDLELLRQSQDQRSAHLDAIREGIRSIQHAKDAIKTVLEAVPVSLDHERAALLLAECRERISRCYEEQLPRLEDADDSIALHDAKNLAMSLEARFREVRPQTPDGALPVATARRLRRARRELTQHQQTLRDSLMSKAAISMKDPD